MIIFFNGIPSTKGELPEEDCPAARRLAYKAEHAVDLQTEVIVAATVTTAERGDGASGTETLIVAQWNLRQSGSAAAVTQLVADRGYHDNRLLTQCADWQVRTYIPERKQKSRCWTDKPEEYERAFRGNRRRVRSEKGRRLKVVRLQRTISKDQEPTCLHCPRQGLGIR
jgi:transposase